MYVFLLTATLWTLQEYLLHRFFLHCSTMHSRHHANPRNEHFLPVVITLCFGVINFAAAFAWMGLGFALVHLAGNVVCYSLFEMTHLISHHHHQVVLLEGPRHFHLRHHASKGTVNFGFTSATWDIVFGTCDPSWTMTRWGTLLLLIPLPVLPLVLYKQMVK